MLPCMTFMSTLHLTLQSLMSFHTDFFYVILFSFICSFSISFILVYVDTHKHMTKGGSFNFYIISYYTKIYNFFFSKDTTEKVASYKVEKIFVISMAFKDVTI